MKLVIDKNRKVYSAGTWGTKNENNYEILNFEFPEELEEYNKRIVYYLGDKRVWDAIVYNKAYITNAITKYEKVNAYVWLTKNETITLKYVCDGTEEGNYYFTYDNVNYYFTMPEVEENDELIFDVATSTLKLDNTTIATTSTGTGTELTFETIIDAEEDFRTQLFEMQFYENENADGIVPTPVQVDGFNTMLTAMNNKITEIDTLETAIEGAEADRVLAEQGRVNAENTRVSNENTRQSNEQTRQTQEASREQRTDQAIAQITDMTEAYNQNAQQKTEAFNQNASNKTSDFNDNASSKKSDFNSNAESKTTTFNNNASSKTSDFNTNATNKTNAFDSNASSKTTTFNNNVTSKTTDFNTNAENKTTAFNSNATDKTTNFDNNASSKTTTFNENATSKTTAFNDNATQKTTDFNNNAQAKTDAFDEHTAEITADIEELQQEVDELSENMPWNTTEQATEIQVTDAARWNRNKMQIFGNTEQTQYRGVQLFDKKNANILDNTYIGSSTLGISSGAKTLYISCQSNTTYTISRIAGQRFIVGDTNVTPANQVSVRNRTADNTGTSITITTSADASYLVVFYYLSSADTLTPEAIIDSLQIEQGDTTTDYEPYVGGVPSPNPDYPQDIHVVTGNNSVGVQGKNLFKYSDYARVVYTGVAITNTTNNSFRMSGKAAWSNMALSYKLKKNTDYVLNSKNTCNIGAKTGITILGTNVKDYTSSDLTTISASTYITLSPNVASDVTKTFNSGDYEYIVFRFVNNGSSTALAENTDMLVDQIQLEEGQVQTSFEPYYHADYPINLGSLELCKIGGKQDYLYKENGNWYKYGAIEKLVLDGTETGWIKVPTATVENRYYKQDILTDPISPALRTIYCNYFAYGGVSVSSVNMEIGKFYSWSSTLPNRLTFAIDVGDNLGNFKTWLSTHKPTIYYEKYTPTSTQITDETLISQLDAIYEHLQLVKGTNHITVTAEDIAPYMDLTYMQDLPSKLDNLDSRLSLLE